MKKLFLFTLFCVPMFVFAQDCTGKISAARASMKIGNYRLALAQYAAAAADCGASKSADIQKEILEVYDKVEKLKEKADKANKEAQAERINAQNALANLKKFNAYVVKLILDNADQDILNFRYDDALTKIQVAANLDTLKNQTANHLIEISFWYGELGKYDRAKNILDSVAMLINKPVIALQTFRETIKAFDVISYKRLMERYYPVMENVEGGSFDMGCDPNVNCKDLQQKEVKSFQMAKNETTGWQYYLFCKATGHKYESFDVNTKGTNPVVNINWDDTQEYCQWLNSQLAENSLVETGNSRKYRLPMEEEWEYAAKGGKYKSPFIYSGDNNLDSIAWHKANSNGYTHIVGSNKGNALGLFDMSGNVWEWCQNIYDVSLYYSLDGFHIEGEPIFNGVRRGGSWEDIPTSLRCANRELVDPEYLGNSTGFRIVKAAP